MLGDSTDNRLHGSETAPLAHCGVSTVIYYTLEHMLEKSNDGKRQCQIILTRDAQSAP
jgi:hypothetical protein